MEKAIKRMRTLAEFNNKFADQLETGEIKLTNATEENRKSLVKTYRFWSHCLNTSAFLLENDET